MGSGNAGCDDRRAAGCLRVQAARRRRRVGRNPGQLVVQFQVEFIAKYRGGGPAGRVLAEVGPAAQLFHRTEGDVLAGMADPGGGTDHDRQTKGLGELEGDAGQLLCLQGGGGIENRDLGHHGHHPRILFRLGGMGAGIVGRDHHEAADRAEIGGTHEGIGSHVEPHLLHGGGSPQSALAGSIGDLEGDLFVDRPFDMHDRACGLLPGLHRREDFRCRRAGIRCRNSAAMLHQTAGQGLVPLHQHLGGLLHASSAHKTTLVCPYCLQKHVYCGAEGRFVNKKGTGQEPVPLPCRAMQPCCPAPTLVSNNPNICRIALHNFDDHAPNFRGKAGRLHDKRLISPQIISKYRKNRGYRLLWPE